MPPPPAANPRRHLVYLKSQPRPKMPLTIAQLGQPVLREIALSIPLGEIPTPKFQQFLAAMHETLAAASGAGLATPQVSVRRRVFLASLAPDAPAQVFFNPYIIAVSREQLGAWEECLSFPELLVYVQRAGVVRVEFFGAKGRSCHLELVGLPARVVQHELDHLDGILTIDRAVSTLDIVKATEIDVVIASRAAGPAPGTDGEGAAFVRS